MAFDSTWPDWIIPVLFIDGSLILGLIMLVIGVLTRKSLYVILAGVLIAPFIFYLGGNPGWRWVWLIPVAVSGLGCLLYWRGRAVHSA